MIFFDLGVKLADSGLLMVACVLLVVSCALTLGVHSPIPIDLR